MGQFGRSSPWQQCTRCESVLRIDSILTIFRSSSARCAAATFSTLLLGRLRSCQSFTSSLISGIEKPGSRDRLMKCWGTTLSNVIDERRPWREKNDA